MRSGCTRRTLCCIAFALLLSKGAIIAQPDNGKVTFSFLFDRAPLKLDSMYRIGNDSFRVSTLKLYISALRVLDRAKRTLYTEQESFHLIDLSDPNSNTLVVPAALLQRGAWISFCLGVDSVTNVSGAMGGDLDPTKGMYWTWQSGYINVKLEGSSSRCHSRKHEFQFHLGGYAAPFNAMQVVMLPLGGTAHEDIRLDVSALLQEIDLDAQPSILSPGAPAVELSARIAQLFYH